MGRVQVGRVQVGRVQVRVCREECAGEGVQGRACRKRWQVRIAGKSVQVSVGEGVQVRVCR